MYNKQQEAPVLAWISLSVSQSLNSSLLWNYETFK